jgi:hypothetical protein
MTDTLLIVIAVLLALILWQVGNIAERLKEHYPSVEEAEPDPADYQG